MSLQPKIPLMKIITHKPYLEIDHKIKNQKIL